MSGDRSGYTILVLCSGNIGRSPLAEVMLRSSLAEALGWDERRLEEHGVVVRSAGTDAPIGHAASVRGMAYAAAHGLDLSHHHARQMTDRDLQDADVILCMDNEHMAAVTPQALPKARLIAGDGLEIPDPHSQSDEFFIDIAERVESAVRQQIPDLVAEIAARLGTEPRDRS